MFMATEIEMKLGVPSEDVLRQVLEDPELTNLFFQMIR